jgi:DNA-binding NarL/FixJ family response regulator
MKITLGIIDDHQLFVRSLALLIESFNGSDVTFEVVADALGAGEFLQRLATLPAPPDIVLVDVSMPEINGIWTAEKIARLYPLTRMIALSTKDDDITVISMFRAGCCAYLQKDIHPNELRRALVEVNAHGFYNADSTNIRYRRLNQAAREEPGILLSEKEKLFLQLSCSDLTYKQIAGEMNMSERTIDGYRESLFEKFNVQSRVGMALEAIRRNYVHL